MLNPPSRVPAESVEHSVSHKQRRVRPYVRFQSVTMFGARGGSGNMEQLEEEGAYQ